MVDARWQWLEHTGQWEIETRTRNGCTRRLRTRKERTRGYVMQHRRVDRLLLLLPFVRHLQWSRLWRAPARPITIDCHAAAVLHMSHKWLS